VDGEHVVLANEEWRRDPERLAAATQWYEEQINKLERIHRLLAEAEDLSFDWYWTTDGGFGEYLKRVRGHVLSARYDMRAWIDRGHETLAKSNEETAYFGNMAAFGWDKRERTVDE